jgi:hypothetical protein
MQHRPLLNGVVCPYEQTLLRYGVWMTAVTVETIIIKRSIRIGLQRRDKKGRTKTLCYQWSCTNRSQRCRTQFNRGVSLLLWMFQVIDMRKAHL